jgi:monoamine oxidase
VTILEARDRCGGRIHPLPSADFGYPAEGGAEFVHGEAPVTHGLLREAGLSLLPIQGTQWTVEDYDAADPERASVLALREEWMDGGRNTQARIIGGYGALVEFLTAECRNHGVAVHLGSAVSAIEASNGWGVVRCANGDAHEYDAVVLTVPLPLLKEIVLPPVERERAAAATHIGFGNVIKILLRFETRWWVDKRMDLADLTFLLSDARIPVWWTQHPTDLPVLTGWFGGPKTEAMANLGEHELIEVGLALLAEIFGFDPKQLMRNLVAARAIN